MFDLLRKIAFLFATFMLIKYYIFLVIAPFYIVKESYRKYRLHKKSTVTKNKSYSPLITIIIPAWNEEVGIIRTIKSVVQNSYPKKEIVVINDGSTDKTGDLIRSFLSNNNNLRSKIKYYSQTNGGKGSALNLGVRAATGEIIVTVDADSILSKHALTNLIPYFEDPSISAVVGNVKISLNHSLIGFLQYLEYLFGFYFKRAHAVLGAEYVFGGACAAYRATVFKRIGYFSTSNKTEDIEMSLRTRFSGFKCTYAEDVVCYTEGASTIKGLIDQRLRWKKGRFDTFIRYRRMFFSLSKRHNKFLCWFILPFALLAEFQLIFEPIALGLLAAYSFISGDYVSLALGSLFIFTIYLVNAIFSHEGVKLWRILLFPLTWPLFYILVWIEYLALLRGMILVLRGDDVVWQNWERQGISAE